MEQVQQTLSQQLRIGEYEIERRKFYMGFTDEDVELLKSSRGWVEPLIPALVKSFYNQQVSIPEISLIIGDKETLNNLHYSMNKYILDIFSGCYGVEYVDKRLRIGKVHQRIGVSPKLYLCGINELQLLLEDMVDDNRSEYEGEGKELKRAIRKLLYFDNQFVFETYIAALKSEVETVNTRLEAYASSLEMQVVERTKELTELSVKDPLTNLYNQRAFYEQLEKGTSLAMRTNGHFSVLYMDVNKFKDVNDTYGHLIGDKVLVAVAEAITSVSRRSETAARYGGDEFCILLPDTKLEAVTDYCKRLFKRFDELKPVPVTLSIGGAEINKSIGFDMNELMIRGDKQMYRAKRLAHESKQHELVIEPELLAK